MTYVKISLLTTIFKFHWATVMFFCLSITNIDAQLLEANYWNYNYGTKGQILSGAVVGGINDQSSIFYNPAFIGIDSTQGFSISLFSPTYSRIKSNSEQFNNEKYRKLATLPNMLVLDYSIFKSPKFSSAFAIFEREKVDIRILSKYEKAINSSNNFEGSVNYRSKINERIYAAGVSYEYHPNFRIGYTLLLSTRSQLQIINSQGSVFQENQDLPVSAASRFKEVDFSKLAFLSKVGVFWKKGIFSTGFTVTTPTHLTITSGAGYQYLQSRTVKSTLLSNDTGAGENLQLTYKLPWSISFGCDFIPYQSGKFYFTVSHFFEVADYALFENSEEDDFSIRDGKKAVSNIAIGYENKLSNSFTLLTGLRTNAHNRISNYNEVSENYLNKLAWNTYHASIGGYFNIRSFRFSAGVEFTFSNKNQETTLNPYRPIYESLGIFEGIESELEPSSFRGLTLFLNYSLLIDRILK